MIYWNNSGYNENNGLCIYGQNQSFLVWRWSSPIPFTYEKNVKDHIVNGYMSLK